MIRSSTFCASSQITGAVRKSLRFSPTASASFRRGHRSSSAAPRKVITAAVPVPTADVIEDTDATTLLTLEERFRIADTDGNGRIDRVELKALLESVEGGLAYPLQLTQGWMPQEAVDSAMERYDKDKSGDIDFEEFRQLVYDGMLLEGALQEYEDAFRAVDDSGNGTIGATELAQLFKNLGTPLTIEKVAEVFMKYDMDQSGQIEFSEFLMMFQDQLLDLGKVKAWLSSRGEASWGFSGKGSLLETVEGDVSVIFSQGELEEALAAHPDQLVVLFCGLTWCRPCKAVGRAYEKLAKAYNKVVFLKLYGNANLSCKKLFQQFKIRSTPSFLFFRAGELVETCSGGNKVRLETNLRGQLQEQELTSAPLYETASEA